MSSLPLKNKERCAAKQHLEMDNRICVFRETDSAVDQTNCFEAVRAQNRTLCIFTVTYMRVVGVCSKSAV